jgi:SNF2 family DNA or RNA helicase
MHVNFDYCKRRDESSTSDPLIYFHTSQKNQVARDKISFDLEPFLLQENPFMFIDDGSKALPPSDVLSRFRIVLTSYNRLTAEVRVWIVFRYLLHVSLQYYLTSFQQWKWKLGSVEQEVKASKKGSVGERYWGEEGFVPKASPLLKVHWLRLIVDEGHVMGKDVSNAIQFASWVSADRRWVMTGTPTQQISSQNGLRQLFHLSNFLKHEFFARELGQEKTWTHLISRGWKDEKVASFFRLSHLLSFLMIRHTKADLVEIPPPIFSTSYISLSQSETTTYNTLAAVIRTNLITTSMEGRTSGWQDSLLNPRQSRFASEALTNLRVACCGGCQIVSWCLHESY